MNNKLAVALIIFALIVGTIVGSITFSQIKYIRRNVQLQDYPEYIEVISTNGFRLENRSIDVQIWATPESFNLFITYARWYDIRTIYYSENEYGRIYFWFNYQVTQVIRWDCPQ